MNIPAQLLVAVLACTHSVVCSCMVRFGVQEGAQEAGD